MVSMLQAVLLQNILADQSWAYGRRSQSKVKPRPPSFSYYVGPSSDEALKEVTHRAERMLHYFPSGKFTLKISLAESEAMFSPTWGFVVSLLICGEMVIPLKVVVPPFPAEVLSAP